MNTTRATTMLLLAIILLLSLIASRPYLSVASAQPQDFSFLHIQSGVWRGAGVDYGISVIDMRTGNHWGVPIIMGRGALGTVPQPVFLGRFPLEAIAAAGQVK